MTETLVYRYGLLAPTEGAEIVHQQLRAAHRYANKLVELERERREQLRAADLTPGTVAELHDRVKDAEAELDHALAVVRETRKDTRTRSETAEQRARVKACRAAVREAKAALRERRREAREDPEMVAARDAANVTFREALKRERAACGVFWGTYQLVEDSIKQAQRMPLWDGADPNDPRFRRWRGEGQVSVQVQGGISPGELLSGEDRRVSAVPSTAEDRRKLSSRRRQLRQRMVLSLRVGSDGRDPVWARWPMVMHRPLPADARIKRVTVQRRMVADHEQWHVLMTLETERPHMPCNGEAVAVDLGWRLRAEGAIRVGCAYSTTGEDRELVVPGHIAESLAKAESIRGIRDRHLDAVKDRLSRWLAEHRDHLPEPVREAAKFMAQWRAQRKMARLRAVWRENRFAGDTEAYDAIDAWWHRDRHLWQWQDHQRGKTLRRRRDLYRYVAADLASRFGTLVLEDFDLRRLARRPLPEADADNEAARLNRVRSSPSEFRDALVNAFRRRGGYVQTVPAQLTTMTCHKCGEVETFDAAAMIRHKCKNGHDWDQDENAARNILDRWRGGDTSEIARDGDAATPSETRWQRARRLGEERRQRMDRSRTGSKDAVAS